MPEEDLVRLYQQRYEKILLSIEAAPDKNDLGIENQGANWLTELDLENGFKTVCVCTRTIVHYINYLLTPLA